MLEGPDPFSGSLAIFRVCHEGANACFWACGNPGQDPLAPHLGLVAGVHIISQRARPDLLRMPLQTPFGGLAERIAEVHAADRRWQLWSALQEGERKEHEPFDEYIELLLHFLWTSCFAIVWPLGTVFALINQLLEYRFDCVKLLAVRRRRFPSTRHMSVAWVPLCAKIVCHVSILVNISLLLMPYRQMLVWSPDSCSEETEHGNALFTACRLPQILGAFGVTWMFFMVVRFLATTLARTWHRHFEISASGNGRGTEHVDALGMISRL